MPNRLEIETVVSAPFDENSYVVHREGDPRCLVVDPGFEPELIQEVIERKKLELEVILLTHGHVDHIAGCDWMKRRYPRVPQMIGAGDARMLDDPFLNLSALGGIPVTAPPADVLLQDGQVVEAIGIKFEVRAIPGHSPGHIAFIWHEGTPPIVFGGDVLFRMGVGRVDFPGGDGKLLVEGIRSKLYTLPEDSIVYPGHGPATTVGMEKSGNPFTTGLYRLE